MARTFISASSQYLSVASALVSAEPFTMSIWFKAAALATQGLMSVDNGASASEYYYLSPRSDGTLIAYSGVGGPSGSVSTGTYSAGVWTHAAGVWASSSSRLVYLNGVPGTLDTTTKTLGTQTRTHIGSLWGSAQFTGADLAEAGLWSVALSADEITALARGVAPALIRPASLVGYWPLNGNDSPEPDRWKNRHDLTLNNSPTKGDHPRVYRQSSESAIGIQNLFISGITRNSVGSPLGGCTVKRFRTSDDALLSSTTSDGSGNYSLVADSQPSYLVAYKAGSPDVAGVTVNTIVGV